MKKIGVALLGLGTVGFGTYKILTDNKAEIEKKHGVSIEVKHILEKNPKRAEETGVNPRLISTDINNVINDPEISIVAEFFGGIEPARSYLIACLKAGKSIVTANKELFSKHWAEFNEVAEESGAGIYFEASCMGGVPIVRTLTAGLQGDNILSIAGIFNGTTNYILTNMADNGEEYGAVLKRAQDLGYAEANPSADVDGFDSMYKLSILASLAFNKKVPLNKIYREGISKISKEDIERGKDFGYTLKLIAMAKNKGKIDARVHPMFVENSHPLASVKSSFNAVVIEGDNVGDVMLYGRGAGDLPTGSAVVSDIVYCALQKEYKRFGFKKESDKDYATDFVSKYYIRMTVDDKSGVLAKIAGVFGKYEVSINSMHQKPLSGGVSSIVFLIHETSELNINKAIAEIKSLNVLKEVDALIRIF
ncbi:MAG: homoserine dehydrogenase [Firmicutes bacterium]|nr:homoserine dehydrogenase [Bacillota bacterium]